MELALGPRSPRAVERLTAGAAVLLVHHALDDHVAAQIRALLAQAAHREQVAGQGALGVVAAPPIQPAVLDLTAEGRALDPSRAGGHGVDVGGEEGRAPAT